ncbi:MAG: N-acetyl-gamma-glutamyl-phosphate reductase [Firmicutes bacterium]|jgi:N-acetyl-gamma-glutamyl-phosphate reductase|nr:N-acetyl-gamma-glutamyl-phosphate reductase [Bacillota bacterium]
MRVGIIGVTGYTGNELLRLLFSHGGVEITYVTSHSYSGKSLADIHPHYREIIEPVCRSFSVEEAAEKTDLIFSALPHGESMEKVPLLRDAGVKVIDLSADFRLADAALYPRWYKREHCAPHYLKEAIYGLPELYREEIKKASLVANPGCYPTSVLLGLLPLAIRGNLADWDTLVVDAKSGTSGAGRVPSQNLHYPECSENFRAYRVAGHQHTPEMEQELGKLVGRKVSFTFVPHLLPMIRGILSTIYLSLNAEITEEEITGIYSGFYANEKFVRVLPATILPETRNVYAGNYCDLSLKLDTRNNRLIIISAIDNLVKGAAGQAVQNMNLMLGFKEEQGLEMVPLRP